MTELIELLKPILWIVVVFGILMGSSFLALFVFVFIKIIRDFKEFDDDWREMK